MLQRETATGARGIESLRQPFFACLEQLLHKHVASASTSAKKFIAIPYETRAFQGKQKLFLLKNVGIEIIKRKKEVTT